MKIITKSNSRNLRKEDVPQPIIAIISEVQVQTFEKTARSPREDKDMLHFADPSIKPLGLNVTNKRVLIAAYGDSSVPASASSRTACTWFSIRAITSPAVSRRNSTLTVG